MVGPVGNVRPLGGQAWLVDAGGRGLVAKLGPGVLDESDGLRQLAAVPGAPPVPEVVHAENGLIVTTAVEQMARRPGHDESLGRSLAVLHSAPSPQWGGGSSWIGACPVDPSPSADGAAFYDARLLELARRCGLDELVTGVVDRLGELLPPERPALVHGDLWWGNVLSGADGRSWLIDPSVHGGHPEEDLASSPSSARSPTVCSARTSKFGPWTGAGRTVSRSSSSTHCSSTPCSSAGATGARRRRRPGDLPDAAASRVVLRSGSRQRAHPGYGLRGCGYDTGIGDGGTGWA